MILKIFTYVKMQDSTQLFINSIINYEKSLKRIKLSYLTMEFTKQTMSDSMLYKQAGNSITVNVIKKVIKNIYK